VKDIDFLPRRYRDEHAHRSTIAWRAVVMVCYAALLTLAAWSQSHRKQDLSKLLADATQQHDRVMIQANELTQLQQSLRQSSAQAELWAYVRHPWPKTQILAAIVAPLTEGITLSDLRIHRLESENVPAGILRDRVRLVQEGQSGQPDTRTPAERDLATFGQREEQGNLTVTIQGTTRDIAELHSYLGRAGRSTLFSRVELLSIQSEESLGRTSSKFTARAVIRPGYGLPNGPAAPLAGNDTNPVNRSGA
jgi:hypothetical protein